MISVHHIGGNYTLERQLLPRRIPVETSMYYSTSTMPGPTELDDVFYPHRQC